MSPEYKESLNEMKNDKYVYILSIWWMVFSFWKKAKNVIFLVFVTKRKKNQQENKLHMASI